MAVKVSSVTENKNFMSFHLSEIPYFIFLTILKKEKTFLTSTGVKFSCLFFSLSHFRHGLKRCDRKH